MLEVDHQALPTQEAERCFLKIVQERRRAVGVKAFSEISLKQVPVVPKELLVLVEFGAFLG